MPVLVPDVRRMSKGMAVSSAPSKRDGFTAFTSQTAREGGGHFRVTVVSSHFAGLNRVQAQRLVYKILEDEMKSEIHALSINASAPDAGR